jgi:hypothetical protein
LLRLFFLLITLFASTSAFSNTEQTGSCFAFDNPIELSRDVNINECVDVVNAAHLDNNDKVINSPKINKSVSPPLTHTAHQPAAPSTQHRSQASEFAQPIRANLLIEHIEQSPDYVFVEELLASQLNVFADNESQLAQVPLCWFMQFSDNTARLSGWKDSNTLYSSKIDTLLN